MPNLPDRSSNQQTQNKCFNCGEFGHYQRECPKSQRQPVSGGYQQTQQKCTFCGFNNHTYNDCRKRLAQLRGGNNSQPRGTFRGNNTRGSFRGNFRGGTNPQRASQHHIQQQHDTITCANPNCDHPAHWPHDSYSPLHQEDSSNQPIVLTNHTQTVSMIQPPDSQPYDSNPWIETRVATNFRIPPPPELQWYLVHIEGVPTRALIDTGSQVSCIPLNCLRYVDGTTHFFNQRIKTNITITGVHNESHHYDRAVNLEIEFYGKKGHIVLHIIPENPSTAKLILGTDAMDIVHDFFTQPTLPPPKLSEFKWRPPVNYQQKLRKSYKYQLERQYYERDILSRKIPHAPKDPPIKLYSGMHLRFAHKPFLVPAKFGIDMQYGSATMKKQIELTEPQKQTDAANKLAISNPCMYLSATEYYIFTDPTVDHTDNLLTDPPWFEQECFLRTKAAKEEAAKAETENESTKCRFLIGDVLVSKSTCIPAHTEKLVTLQLRRNKRYDDEMMQPGREYQNIVEPIETTGLFDVGIVEVADDDTFEVLMTNTTDYEITCSRNIEIATINTVAVVNNITEMPPPMARCFYCNQPKLSADDTMCLCDIGIEKFKQTAKHPVTSDIRNTIREIEVRKRELAAEKARKQPPLSSLPEPELRQKMSQQLLCAYTLQECNNLNSKHVTVGTTREREAISHQWTEEMLKGATITEEQKHKVERMIISHQQVVQCYDSDSGDTGEKHVLQIHTGDSKPVAVASRYVPHHIRHLIREKIEEYLNTRVIRPSSSPWCAPIVPVIKPDGSLRLCIDYRRLNLVTRKDKYVLPMITEIIDKLGQHKPSYFTTLDLHSGYHQVRMAEESIEKTAFSALGRLWEFIKMPFGLSTAPPLFQRLMDDVLDEFDDRVHCYLDDVLIVSETFEEHFELVDRVLTKLQDNGLMISPKKCNMFQPQVKYLGYILKPEGVVPNPAKVSAITDFPAPTTQKQLRRFLGMVSFYRQFIRNMSKIARPLYQLTEKTQPWRWIDIHQQAFQQLKNALVTAPVLLQYPDLNSGFVIRCDASGLGLGAVLEQVNPADNKLHPVAYASCSLTHGQRKYTATELECLAIRWALEHFRQYIYGHDLRHCEVVVITDHSALDRAMHRRMDGNRRVERWISDIAEYNPRIAYRPGAQQRVPDALSRCVFDENSNSLADYPKFEEVIKPWGPGARANCDNIEVIDQQTRSPNYSDDFLIGYGDESPGTPNPLTVDIALSPDIEQLLCNNITHITTDNSSEEDEWEPQTRKRKQSNAIQEQFDKFRRGVQRLLEQTTEPFEFSCNTARIDIQPTEDSANNQAAFEFDTVAEVNIMTQRDSLPRQAKDVDANRARTRRIEHGEHEKDVERRTENKQRAEKQSNPTKKRKTTKAGRKKVKPVVDSIFDDMPHRSSTESRLKHYPLNRTLNLMKEVTLKTLPPMTQKSHLTHSFPPRPKRHNPTLTLIHLLIKTMKPRYDPQRPFPN